MNYNLDKILKKVQKPGRYLGGELNSVVKNKDDIDVRFAFCFPDTYEVGMSHLGMKILYGLFNQKDYIWCERAFAPWDDMEKQMRDNDISLFALESKDPLNQFDFIGFTIQYELCYTTIINMLDLSKVPVWSKDRGEDDPIVVAGGPCVCNCEPIADFIDIVFLGEGEEVDLEVIDLYRSMKKDNTYTRRAFLKKASQIQGVYVPSLYNVSYNEDNTICSVVATEGAPETVSKCIITDLNSCYYPEKIIVPYIEIIHDRAVEEIFRGCIRGCRFCQAGFIYRPVREKSAVVANDQIKKLCESTGYDELSLSSLSSSDYTQIEELLDMITEWTFDQKINVSLPSLRIDNFSEELLGKIRRFRGGGLTFAPEAGTQRLRNVINKNVTEDDVLKTALAAFMNKQQSIKLYFMIGLPTETDEDVLGITRLCQRIVDNYYHNPNKPKGQGIQISASVSSFVPKAFTPFQWEAQDSADTLAYKHNLLKSLNYSKKIKITYHENVTSFLEGIFARGDRRLSNVIFTAWKSGCKLDSWDEFFDYDKWMKAFDCCNIDSGFYANRKRSFDEILPWDHLDYGVSKAFLINECKKAYEGITTLNCREKCSGCGANKFCAEACK